MANGNITIPKNACLPVTAWEEENIWADDAHYVVLAEANLTKANLKDVWADVRGLLRPDRVDLFLDNVYSQRWTRNTMRNLAVLAWYFA